MVCMVFPYVLKTFYARRHPDIFLQPTQTGFFLSFPLLSSPVLLFLKDFFFLFLVFGLFLGIMRVFVVAVVVLCFVGSCFAVAPACKAGKILLFFQLFFLPIVFFSLLHFCCFFSQLIFSFV